MGKIEYTDEQRARALELWERILDAHGIHLRETWRTQYGGYDAAPIDAVSPDWLAALVATDGEGTEDLNPVEVNLMAYGDYGGSDLDAANIRALDGTPGITIHRYGHHGDVSATMQAGELPGDDTDPVDDRLDHLESIVEILDGLADYPLIDEEIHTQYVDELADAAWDDWLRSDVISDLERVALDGWEITDGVADELRTAYYACEENAWSCETATTVHNYRHADALAHAALVVLGWDYPTLNQERKERDAREQQEREAFSVTWHEYLAAYPIPYLQKWGGRETAAYLIMRERGALPATVDGIRAMVREDSERAAYREANERATASV